jgi:hypothetical protein
MEWITATTRQRGIDRPTDAQSIAAATWTRHEAAHLPTHTASFRYLQLIARISCLSFWHRNGNHDI